MEDLPFGRIAALVPEFAVKDLPLGTTLMMMIHVFYTDGTSIYHNIKQWVQALIIIIIKFWEFLNEKLQYIDHYNNRYYAVYHLKIPKIVLVI